jgi:hypothetical protein
MLSQDIDAVMNFLAARLSRECFCAAPNGGDAKN